MLALNTDPVTIKQVEISIVERAFDDGIVAPQPPVERTGRTVAVDRLRTGRVWPPPSS